MKRGLDRALWVAGSPVRLTLVWLIRGYRATLGQAMGGRCRFYPSCSAYAEQAIAQLGPIRGVSLSVWRVLRCSPLTQGGVDYPPGGRGTVTREATMHSPGALYDADIHAHTGHRAGRGAGSR
jgi:putative membrane protein insertion efficiency factor